MCQLQAWRAPHPPARGNLWLGTKPLVHVGFLKSWVAGGLNQRVVGRVSELVRAASAAGTTFRIYVTGGCWAAWSGSADRWSLWPADVGRCQHEMRALYMWPALLEESLGNAR